MYCLAFSNKVFEIEHCPTRANKFSEMLALAKPISTYPSVVIVTMVYQKAAGMLVNLVADEPFSA